MHVCVVHIYHAHWGQDRVMRTQTREVGGTRKARNGDINGHAVRDFKNSRQLYSVAILK